MYPRGNHSIRHDRPLLDALRWMSAMAVAVGHAAALVVAPDTGTSLPWTLAARLWHVIAAARDPSVIVFFVLSGYLVGGNVVLRRASFSWSSYLVARFSRIFVVLVPAVIFAVSVDVLAMTLFPASPVYFSVWPPGALGLTPLISSYNWQNLLSTLLAVTGLVGNEIGTTGPVWSLSLEWLFYFVFPMIVVLVTSLKLRVFFIPIVAVGVAIAFSILIAVPTGIFLLMWCCGAWARYILEGGGVFRWLSTFGGWAAIGAYAATAILEPSLSHVTIRVLQICIAAGLALYLSRNRDGESGVLFGLDQYLADRSYSLYLIHLPVMTFITAAFVRFGVISERGVVVDGLGALSVSLLCVALMVFASLIVCWGFAAMFEMRTAQVRKYLARYV